MVFFLFNIYVIFTVHQNVLEKFDLCLGTLQNTLILKPLLRFFWELPDIFDLFFRWFFSPQIGTCSYKKVVNHVKRQ